MVYENNDCVQNIHGRTMQWQKEKSQKSKQLLIKHYIENKRLSNMNPTKTGEELRCCRGETIPAPLVTPIV
jgi:hypothetical protein